MSAVCHNYPHRANPLSPFDAVVLGASLGGVEGTIAVLSSLPADFQLPIVIVQHRSPHGPRVLARILAEQSGRPVHEAQDGDVPKPGHSYVAPPDHHVMFDTDRKLRLDRGARVYFTRPAIDVLFISAAHTYRDRLLAVLLTGGNEDGAEGVRAVKAAGGRVLVQAGSRLPYARMPLAAVATRCVDFALPLPALTHAIVTLAMVPGAAALFSASVGGAAAG